MLRRPPRKAQKVAHFSFLEIDPLTRGKCIL